MFVISKNGAGWKPLISESEKELLKKDLQIALDTGGQFLFIKYSDKPASKISVFNSNKDRIGYIVGNSAMALDFLLQSSPDNVFMSVPIDIQWVIKEYLT